MSFPWITIKIVKQLILSVLTGLENSLVAYINHIFA